jgi:cytochrome c biogenesis protein CcdA
MEVLTAFLGGLLASLSPCVYPLIPLTLSFLGAAKSVKPVLIFTTGKVITLLLLGVFAVRAGEALGYTSQLPSVQIAMGLFLCIFGTYSFLDKVPPLFSKLNGIGSNFDGSAFLLGAGSALLVSPCTTPILYSVLVIVATTPSRLYGLTVMFAYAIGFSAILLILGLGLVKKLPKSGTWLKLFHKLSSTALFCLGLYYFYLGFKQL